LIKILPVHKLCKFYHFKCNTHTHTHFKWNLVWWKEN